MTADGGLPAGHPDRACGDCSDALSTAAGDPAVGGEIDSLERSIQRGLEKLDQPPYLRRGNARELLEEIAYRAQGAGTQAATMVELVLASARLNWPPELGEAERRAIVTHLLGGSGIVLAENGDFRFADAATREYLAACHVVRRHPRGPRWWRPRTWKYLAPRAAWPWPDAGVMLFLAALWWRDARPFVDGRLRRLLHERYRDPNIRFVIELIRRDLIPGSDLRERTVDILRRGLADGRQDERRWTATAECLHLLDPTMAMDELESVNRSPGPTITSRCRFLAVAELTKHDPARGAENLAILANSLTGQPQDRFDTAVLISDRNGDLGARTMRLLANTADMGELRVDAAIHVGSPTLLGELVERERTLSDNGRLRLLAELLRLDSSMAVTATEKFAHTAREEDTPLRIADMIRHVNRDAALRIANTAAWPTNHKIVNSVRLQAVILIGTIDPTQAIQTLDRLSRDPSVTDAEVRLSAAIRIVTEHGGPITALVDLGNDPDLDRPYRVEAAKAVGELERDTGAQLYISIAKTCTPTDRSRLTLLRNAYALDPAPAAEALAEDAETKGVPGPIRLGAVETGGPMLGRLRTIELYTTIATTTDNDTALAAARKVTAMDTAAGQQLMGKLCSRPNTDPTFRLTAALEAGRHGRSVLMNLAHTARSDTVRLKATTGLYAIDKKAGEAAIQRLVKTSRAGTIRIDAALILPEKTAADALITIVKDRHEKETVRFDAAVKAKGKNEKKGRQALLILADAPRITKKTRDKIDRLLRHK